MKSLLEVNIKGLLQRMNLEPLLALLFLTILGDRLLEEPILVAQSIAPRRVVQSGQGVQKARSQSAQPSITKGSVWLLLGDSFEVIAEFVKGFGIRVI